MLSDLLTQYKVLVSYIDDYTQHCNTASLSSYEQVMLFKQLFGQHVVTLQAMLDELLLILGQLRQHINDDIKRSKHANQVASLTITSIGLANVLYGCHELIITTNRFLETLSEYHSYDHNLEYGDIVSDINTYCSNFIRCYHSITRVCRDWIDNPTIN